MRRGWVCAGGLAFIATILAIDGHVDFHGQLVLGAVTWLTLLAALRLFEPERRAQALVVVAAATCGEVTGSILWGVYSYRLHNLPVFVPPGHGIVYLTGFALSTTPFARRHSRALVVAAAVVAAGWGIAGLGLLPRLDVAGAFGVPLLLFFLWRSPARATYAGVFLVVAALELYGTSIGTWEWARALPGLGIPDGNPPSGVASGYVCFDVVALALAPRLLAAGPRDPGREPAERRRERLRLLRRCRAGAGAASARRRALGAGAPAGAGRRSLLTDPVNVFDYERLAAERLDEGALSYFAGGSGDEHTLRQNLEAYRRWILRPRVLCDVGSTTTETTVLGTQVSMPLIVAPVAFQRVAHPDGETGTACAAAAAGTIMCLSTIATTTPAEVAAAAPDAPRWFQLYVFKDWAVTEALIQQAVEAGFSAIVLTVDTPYLGRREGPLRTGFAIPDEIGVPAVDAARGGHGGFSLADHFSLFSPSVSWRDLERFRTASQLPLVLKGVLTAEDARLACEHGADAIVVSNHGGRQLDGVSGTLDALPEVVEAVDGRIEVLLDGGIRRGTDVVKALALGARACLAGRAVLWGLTVDGEAGARRVLELLREEISLALSLLGCTSPDEVRRDHVGPAPR